MGDDHYEDAITSNIEAIFLRWLLELQIFSRQGRVGFGDFRAHSCAPVARAVVTINVVKDLR